MKSITNNKVLMIIIAAVISVLAASYIGVSVYFTNHFLFNTYVNDIPAFGMTATEIEKENTDHLNMYSLKVLARGGITDTISSQDIGLSLVVDGQFEEALKEQNAFLWPKFLFTDTHLTTEHITSYSRDVVEEKINNLQLFKPENIIAPTDAHIPDESGENGFEIAPEDYGQDPIMDKVAEKIFAALDVLESEVTLDDECYKAPSVFSDDPTLVALRDNLNTYCKAKITYEFGADQVVVDGTRIKEWCVIDGTNVSFDEEKVKEFVKEISRKYDTFGKSRTIPSHTGSPVTVSGGDYGWWMDRATEAKELIEAIKKGESGVRTPVYFATAVQYGDNDWGNSYVEIDLTEQHLWVYKDGSVVLDSDFVSGCVNKKRTTPTGSYAITYKERDATLVGENYSSSVKYWMPFNGNVGMHDASWRSSFGGDEYIRNGSHGCINLPTAKAAQIYEIVTKGEAVFVYGGITSPVTTTEQVTATPEAGETTEGTTATADAANAATQSTTADAATAATQTTTTDAAAAAATTTAVETAPATETTPAPTPVEEPAPAPEPEPEESHDSGESEPEEDYSEE